MTGWTVQTFDPHDPSFLKDPFPYYARFREEAPVTIVQPYGGYWVFRYDDVKAVLDDTERFTKASPAPKPPPPPYLKTPN